MKKVLFICKSFAPNNSVASIRPSKWAKYLSKMKGYEISVLKLQTSEGINDELLSKDLEYVKKVYNVPQKCRNAIGYYDDGDSSFWRKINRKVGSLREYAAEWLNTQQNFLEARKYINKKLCYESWDIIISSSGPFITHMIASTLKKRSKETVWIADYRDPVPITLSHNSLLRRISRNRVKGVTKSADAIIGATVGCYANMEIYDVRNCYEITNGFDPEDLLGIHEEKADKFTLSYTGTIHLQKSDVSIVFKALNELIIEGRIRKDRVAIRYAGRMTDEFIRQAKMYNVQDIVESYGYVNRKRSLELQKGSHILLLASFNYEHQNDIITGKFYEYLMNRKPIVCTVVGNKKHSRLKQLIDKINCGMCWEEANSIKDYLRLKEYLLLQYNNFIKNGDILYTAKEYLIEEFDYRYIVNQLDKIIDHIFRSRR